MSNMLYKWAVVGAGPAGIAAVGKLLDHNIDAQDIVWIDPDFAVGDFGQKWFSVPSNTKVGLFIRFLYDAKSFHFGGVEQQFELCKLDANDTCFLGTMAEPLRWVTQELRSQVNSIQTTVESLQLKNQLWHLNIGQELLQAKNVILAIGAQETELDYPDVMQIDLATAMNPQLLKQVCCDVKSVAVFGSSHSAILAIRNLVECGVSEIVNFYRSPLRYALYMNDGWIMYDDTGLKGSTAQWAHEYIDTDLAPGLVRYYSSDEHVARYLPDCERVIYTVGFERRQSLKIAGYPSISYDRHTGIIAPGLFGLGIAFPEAHITPLGSISHRVGLWKFMEYLNRILPIWLRYNA